MKTNNIKQLAYLSKNGDCDATIYLANHYFDNRDQDDNGKKAFEYLTQAVETKKNTGELFYKLGTCYQFGIGTAQDIKKAISIFEQASSMKNGKAQNALGLIYMYGEGVEKNYKVAQQYFLESKENKSIEADFYLDILPVEIELDKIANIDKLDKDKQKMQKENVEQTYRNNFSDEQKVYFYRNLANQVKLDIDNQTLSDTKIAIFFNCFITAFEILKFINRDELQYLCNLLIEALSHYTTSEEALLNKQATVYYYLANICDNKQAIDYCNMTLSIFDTIKQKKYNEEIEYKFFTLSKLIELEYKEKNFEKVITISKDYFDCYSSNNETLKKYTYCKDYTETIIAYSYLETENYVEAKKIANKFLENNANPQDDHILLTSARYYDILARIEYSSNNQKAEQLYEKCYKCVEKTSYNKYWKQSYLANFKLSHAKSLLKIDKEKAKQSLKELYHLCINEHFTEKLDKMTEIVKLYCDTLVESNQIEDAIVVYSDFNNEISRDSYNEIGPDKIYLINAKNFYTIAMLYKTIKSEEKEKKYLLKAYEKLQDILNRDDEFADFFKKVVTNLEKYK